MCAASRYLFLVLALALGGCVLPNRLAEEDPFRDDVIGFIESGITSRAEIETQLGDPYLESSDGQWWVFPADRRMTEWFWIFCMPGGCGGAEFGGDVRRYNLIVEFDYDGIVREWAVVTGESPCAGDQSICLDNGEVTVIQDGNALKYTLEDDASKTPCAFLRHKILHESDDSPTQFFDFRDAECLPALVMRDGLIYALESTEPYTGQLTVSGIEGIGKLERSYESGILNGTETIWFERGEQFYKAFYKNNLLHGPVTYGTLDGTTEFLLCYENGHMTHLNMDDCDP